jgi:hypothetical protein
LGATLQPSDYEWNPQILSLTLFIGHTQGHLLAAFQSDGGRHRRAASPRVAVVAGGSEPVRPAGRSLSRLLVKARSVEALQKYAMIETQICYI